MVDIYEEEGVDGAASIQGRIHTKNAPRESDYWIDLLDTSGYTVIQGKESTPASSVMDRSSSISGNNNNNTNNTINKPKYDNNVINNNTIDLTKDMDDSDRNANSEWNHIEGTVTLDNNNSNDVSDNNDNAIAAFKIRIAKRRKL